MSLTTDITGFLQNVVAAMGMTLTTSVEETPEGTRINLEGEDGGVLVRRGGEGLQALQHLVATAFRRQLGDDNRVVVDCNGFRKEKDLELKQMARYMAEKARSSGMPQEMGPLNPVRTPHRPPGDCRGSRRHVREHRRRVHEDGDHLGAEIAGSW